MLFESKQMNLFATAYLEITKFYLSQHQIVLIPCSSAFEAGTWQTPPRPHQTSAGQAVLTLSPANTNIQYLLKKIS